MPLPWWKRKYHQPAVSIQAELERVAAGRQRGEQPVEPLVVAPEVGRKLPENGPEHMPTAEGLEPLTEQLDAGCRLDEARDVREVAARLDREAEAGWDARAAQRSTVLRAGSR